MTILPRAALVHKLHSLAESEGLHAADSGLERLTAEVEIPLGKWFLGGRKAVYRMSCDIVEAAHVVHFREATLESSWGVPPPSFRTEVTSQSGARVRQTTTVRSPAGGGQFDIGHVRDHIEAAVSEAGWQFHLEAGRMP